MDGVSTFLGITIAFGVDIAATYAETPHFHASYNDQHAVFDIRNDDVLDGSVGERATGFVREWTAAHRAALWSNWHAIQENRALSQIEPLE